MTTTVIVSPVDETVKVIVVPITGLQGPGAIGERRSAYVNPNSYLGRAITGTDENEHLWTVTRITVNPNGTTSTGVATNVDWTGYLTHTYI